MMLASYFNAALDVCHRFANVKSGLISSHPLETTEKNVSLFFIFLSYILTSLGIWLLAIFEPVQY